MIMSMLGCRWWAEMFWREKASWEVSCIYIYEGKQMYYAQKCAWNFGGKNFITPKVLQRTCHNNRIDFPLWTHQFWQWNGIVVDQESAYYGPLTLIKASASASASHVLRTQYRHATYRWKALDLTKMMTSLLQALREICVNFMQEKCDRSFLII